MRPGSMGMEDKKVVHCSILGDGMVGKTSLTSTFVMEEFSNTYIATVFDNHAVPLKVGGEEFVISLFDTAGQRDYEGIRAYTYKESEVLVLCYSVIDRESFVSIATEWIPEIRRYVKRRRPVILVATQVDLRDGAEPEEEVTTEEGTQLAKEINADYFIECSARSGEGLQEIFEHVIFSALKYRKKKANIINRILRR